MSEIILACIFPNHLYCYWFVGSLISSLIRRSWNSCLEFQGCHVVNFSRFSYKPLILSMSNGEGGIWTLAPLLTTYSLSRGAPSTAWVLLQYQALELSYVWKPAEREGFEPSRPFGQTVFKTASLWPLRYLSICNLATVLSVCCLCFFIAINRRLVHIITLPSLCQHLFLKNLMQFLNPQEWWFSGSHMLPL